jgi:hypothetical protein
LSGSIRVGSLGDEAASDSRDLVNDGVAADFFDDTDEEELVSLRRELQERWSTGISTEEIVEK